MARFESQKKMGYYRTPDKAQTWLCESLTPADGSIFSIDPCCGEGIALEAVGKGLGGKTYGVELDIKRARDSKERLSEVLNCSIFDFTCSKEAFGLLWLNPPYDWDIKGDVGEKSRRMEVTFYYNSLDLLAPGGVLVYLVPDYVIDEHIAKSLCYRFEDIKVVKFYKEEYPVYKQIALIGRKRAKGIYDQDAPKRLIGKVFSAQHMDDVEPQLYTIPATKGPSLFRDANPTIEEMAIEVKKTSLWKDFETLFTPPEPITAIRPMMPLSRGHLATLLTAGVMNGPIEKGGNCVVVKGYVERKKLESSEEDENGRVKVTTIDHTIVKVRYFDRAGKLFEIV